MNSSRAINSCVRRRTPTIAAACDCNSARPSGRSNRRYRAGGKRETNQPGHSRSPVASRDHPRLWRRFFPARGEQQVRHRSGRPTQSPHAGELERAGSSASLTSVDVGNSRLRERLSASFATRRACSRSRRVRIGCDRSQDRFVRAIHCRQRPQSVQSCQRVGAGFQHVDQEWYRNQLRSL